ncbi:hypothetical protein [Microscilla marina]|uniref:Uncharacterized protein n=1 Tax=Microscilla marina ATCC 23134 TaxID=313606 RepID=A1ZTN4_MICM2|nr:hypothetical protein [Microscilla marina]EAY26295.1 hypothetical protein M23134_01618 [Microscilla marina ATCC 23134]
MTHTPQEQKAQKLWTKYANQDEDEFWQEYERLLYKVQHTPAPTRKKRKTKHLASTQAKRKIFHADFGLFVALCLVTLLAAFLIYIIVTSTTNETEMGIFMVATLYLGFAYFVMNALGSAYSFEVASTHLQVYQLVFVKKEKIPWQTIDSVKMKKTTTTDERGQQTNHYQLQVFTLQNGVPAYDYALSQAKHWELIDYLRQHVKTVEEVAYK